VKRRLAKSTTARRLVGGLLIFAAAAVLVTGGAVMLPSAASFAASGLVVLALSRLVGARPSAADSRCEPIDDRHRVHWCEARGRVAGRSRASGPRGRTRRARQQRH
jgi:hypothetical protein